MIRTLKDIIAVLMQIEMNFSKIYRNIAAVDGIYSRKLKSIAAVLAKEEEIHYGWYKNLLEDTNLVNIQLSDVVYEKANQNLKSFKSSILWSKVADEHEIIKAARDYELLNAETLWNIYNIVKEGEEDSSTSLLSFLEELIRIEEQHALNLKAFLK